MSKAIVTTRYQCSKCKEIYNTKEEADSCEKQPITQDKGVEVGDIVIITNGEGAGSEAVVTSVSVVNKYWGHYAWKKYWHTVMLGADIVGSCGSRGLTFDSYKVKQNG